MTDICLILEGTYPYVPGGVASWVNDLVRQLHDTTFSIIYLGAHHIQEKKVHYVIPENVYEFRHINIFDFPPRKRSFNFNLKKDFTVIEEFMQAMSRQDTAQFDRLLQLFNKENSQVTLSDLMYSWESWQILQKAYHAQAPQVSFIDYFWTWRSLFLPFFAILETPLPEAKVYHAISTGYAGILGAMAKTQLNRPFILTEHGIYTRERKIDIAQADWIYSELAHELKVVEEKDLFKDWWINFFMFMSHVAYERADRIITLYEGNRLTQIEEGAPPEKTGIIPNGVNVDNYSVIPRRNPHGPFKVGFVGRVVPIKDVKTFITACQGVYSEIKNVEFLILGPTDEDEDYYKECAQLTKVKSLDRVLYFMGEVRMRDYYRQLDVIVLTSISEAQPLVILEAFASGVPVVATDVGACPELIFGRSADDRLLGNSGLITSICNPQQTAEAIIRILKDYPMRCRMGEVGYKRVVQYYQQNDFIASYQELYNRYLDQIYPTHEQLAVVNG